MNITQEFLSIVPRVFGNNIEISFEKDLPLFFSKIGTVIKIKDYRDNYVICADFSNPNDVYQLYSLFKKQSDFTYLYLFKGFENTHKDEYKKLVKGHASTINSYGDIVTSGNRINGLEYMSGGSNEKIYPYTKKTQLVLKFYFLNKRKPYTVREIASKIGVSPASVARANETMFHLGALTKTGLGAGTEYILKNKKEVIKQLKNEFIKPFESSSLVLIDKNKTKQEKMVLSGQSALAEQSELTTASNVPTTYALEKKQFKTFLANHENEELDDNSEIICVQSYIYDPTIFSKNSCIDLFDIYLTMLFDEDLNDPRVYSAFKEIERKLLNE